MTPQEIGYDLGYGIEKGAEFLISKRLVTSFRTYPNAKGFGFDFETIRFDWHKFKLGGRKTGKFYNLPHIDIPGKVKHWPWHQLNKWKRRR